MCKWWQDQANVNALGWHLVPFFDTPEEVQRFHVEPWSWTKEWHEFEEFRNAVANEITPETIRDHIEIHEDDVSINWLGCQSAFFHDGSTAEIENAKENVVFDVTFWLERRGVTVSQEETAAT